MNINPSGSFENGMYEWDEDCARCGKNVTYKDDYVLNEHGYRFLCDPCYIELESGEMFE